jgi:cytochrome c oxidase subunit 3
MATGTEGPERAGLRDVFDSETQRQAASRFGLGILCLVLSMLFGAVVVLLLILRWNGDDWPTDLPPLPWQVWLSTAILLGESVVLVQAQRVSSPKAVRRAIWLSLVLAIAFMISQAWAWIAWHDAVQGLHGREIATAGLYVVSGVHIAHVLGGLVPLGMLLWYVGAWGDRQRNLLRLSAAYWHFLDGVWIVLVVTLLVVL